MKIALLFSLTIFLLSFSTDLVFGTTFAKYGIGAGTSKSASTGTKEEIAFSIASIQPAAAKVESNWISSVVSPGIQNGIRRFSNRIQRNAVRVLTGTYRLIPTMLENRRLKLIRKNSGDKAITFTEYKFIENSNRDVMKLLFMAGHRYLFGARYSLFKHFIQPMVSSSPWAWSEYPFSYNNVTLENEVRDRVLVNRRKNYLLSALVQTNRHFLDNNVGAIEDSVLADLSPDAPYVPSSPREVLYNISGIADAVRIGKRDLRRAVSKLGILFETKPHNSQQLYLNSYVIPQNIIKDFGRSMHGEGYASWIPVYRWLNYRTVATHLDQLKSSDEFIRNVGIDSLSLAEVKRACHDRCISPVSATDEQMRSRLAEFVDIATDSSHNNTKDISLNVHNRRLVLMGLEVAKDIGLDDNEWKGRWSSFFNRGTDGLIAILRGMLGSK